MAFITLNGSALLTDGKTFNLDIFIEFVSLDHENDRTGMILGRERLQENR